jgi:2-amino-4-hydroxy-6-hydroxymethyldihydropteridine diphosphokinase
MAQLWIGVGSNVDAIRHVRQAVAALGRDFGQLATSAVYRTAAIGFEGDPFLNLVVGCRTNLPLAAVLARLSAIEAALGRERRASRYAARTIDLDLLVFDNLVGEFEGKSLPHPDILNYPFVLGPLAQLAPQARHPALHTSYAALWRERFDAAQRAALEPVDVAWEAVTAE